MQINLRDRVFYKTMMGIALPIALQNLISSSLNMVDTVMIGKLGEKQIAAVGLANQVFFLFILLMFGINSGCAIFTAQFWGKEDILNIRRVMGIALISGIAVSSLFGISAHFMPEKILRAFTRDTAVIFMGSQYLKIVSVSYLITAVSFAYAFASRSIGKAKLPMVVSAVSLLANTGLNYLLIFGKFNFPRMGIQGAALATLIARTIEMILMLGLIYSNKDVLAGTLKEMLSFDYSFFKKVYRTAIPVILNEGFWSLGMIMYAAAYARISTEAIASVQIANTIQGVFMVVSMGLGNSCAIMLGNVIGANRQKEAVVYGNTFCILGLIAGALLGIMLVLLSPMILGFFNISSVVYQNTSKILFIMGLFMAFRFFNTVLIIGILRSGGDTKFSLFLEMGSVWILGVPLAFLGALVFKLPVYWVYGLISLEELVKACIGVPRVISKKWVKNVIENM
ncbi:putative efflux protein, MATE family [Geosporobacter subterraneus DSM 17957]|uniref:Putative efflux protein, MATE family n=1 Tax=Geosporobacter subterraneus DSM 17957 TaxID=1121919 RepID=A0A1M6I9T1_9FIRM|nr:MATE family efflux transporter [Geosporobacter subterraneus]SHJ31259.1 putative efflux protein, MATE family [Geosporobacter subterraneus DSM 17957]